MPPDGTLATYRATPLKVEPSSFRPDEEMGGSELDHFVKDGDTVNYERIYVPIAYPKSGNLYANLKTFLSQVGGTGYTVGIFGSGGSGISALSVINNSAISTSTSSQSLMPRTRIEVSADGSRLFFPTILSSPAPDWRLNVVDEMKLAKENRAKHSENETVPPMESFDDAISFLENASPEIQKRPHIALSGDGEVGLIWDSSDLKLSVTIWFPGDGNLYWSKVALPPARVVANEAEVVNGMPRDMLIEILSIA